MNKPIITIACTTYNHEKFIEGAIRGFLMQKTTFPIEIIIHDDASTDSTASIVVKYAKKYPKLIFPILQEENQYSKGIKPWHNFVFPKAKGKYIALCEGDDYWTDPLKLQKQVDFLDKNSEISATYHNVDRFDYNTKKTDFIEYYKENTFLTEDDIIFAGGKTTPTLSAVFRSKFLNSAPKWVFNSPVGDIPLVFYLMSQGKLYYFKDIMGVYRENLPGSWTQNTKNNNWKKNLTYKVKFTGFVQNYNRFTHFKFSDKLNDLYSSNNKIKHFILNVFAHLYRLKKKILD